MPPLLDLIVIGVVLVSAVLAMMRGFTREVLAIGSWGAAAVAAYLLYKQALPFAQQYIPNVQIATAVSVGGIFLVTLIIVSFITVKISDFILDSRIGAIDRSLGFLFGGARGLLICVIGFIFFTQLVGDKGMPDWVKQAKSRPMLESMQESLVAALPQEFIATLMDKIKKKGTGEGDTTTPPPDPQKRT